MQIFVSDRNYYHHGQQTEGVCHQLSGEATRGAEEDFGEGDGDSQAEQDRAGGEEVQISCCLEGN